LGEEVNLGQNKVKQIREGNPMLEEKVEEVSALLKSIAHPLRLKILCLL